MGASSLDPISNKAVEAALTNNWPEAINLNSDLLKKYPNDVETLNRLARAYFETGSFTKAKTTYRTVLRLDPYNPIANKNFKKLLEAKSKGIKNNGHVTPLLNGNISELFLEDPGRTRIVKLFPTSTKSIEFLRIANKVRLLTKYNDIVVTDSLNHKIGKLEPDMGKRIAKAIRSGSEFESYVVSSTPDTDNSLNIFVRETKHGEKQNNTVFPIEKNEDFKPYATDETIKSVSSEDVSTEESSESNDHPHKDKRDHTSLESLAEKEQEALDDLDEENQA